MINQYLEEYIGKTKTPKLLDEIQTNYFEMFKRKFPNYYSNNITKCGAFVTVLEDKEIKSIGHSCYDDILVDNFGKLLGMIISGSSGITAGTGGGQFVTTGGAGLVQVNGWQTGNTNKFNGISNGAVGTQMQVGKGINPALRTNFNIQTPFTTAPESAVFNVAGDGGWNSGLGKVTIAGDIIANDSGSISETMFLQIVSAFAPQSGLHKIMLSRDNISPAVNFVAGQNINLDYAMVFS